MIISELIMLNINDHKISTPISTEKCTFFQIKQDTEIVEKPNHACVLPNIDPYHPVVWPYLSKNRLGPDNCKAAKKMQTRVSNGYLQIFDQRLTPTVLIFQQGISKIHCTTLQIN